MRGRQEPGPEWKRLCADVRAAVLKLCPLENRRWNNTPGTFRRTEVAQQTGVNFHLLRRLLDENRTVEPDTVIALARWLGWELAWVRAGPPPQPAPPATKSGTKRQARGARSRSRSPRRKGR